MTDKLSFEITRQLEVDDRQIYIIDDLFAKDVIAELCAVYSSKPYFKKPYRAETLEFGAGHSGMGKSGSAHPIIHWNYDIKLEEVPQIAPFRRLAEVTSELYPQDSLSLKRLHINRVAFGDIESPHRDSSDVTAVLFIHSEWDVLWGAELTFFDKNFEALYSVAPKPGRAVIFEGNKHVHRTGVPFQNCYSSRLSAALKFVKTPASS